MGTPAINPEAHATKPKYQVINDILYYQAKAGDELKLDLDFPNDVLEKVYSNDFGEREQFMIMLEAIGNKTVIARVKKMGALEQMRLISRFFVEFHKAVGADMGESEGSSDS